MALSLAYGVSSVQHGFRNIIQRGDKLLDIGVGTNNAADVLSCDAVAAAKCLHVDTLRLNTSSLEGKS